MFSQTNEYALRVVTFLGSRKSGPVTRSQIAKNTRVPAAYLYKILQTLVRARLVSAQRGKFGGYTLARPASRMTVLDVVEVIDPLPRIRACPLKLKAHCRHLCPLHAELDRAFASIEKRFRSATIATLARASFIT